MDIARFVSLLCMAAAGIYGVMGTPESAYAGPTEDPSARCKALQTVDFSMVPDAMTQVIEAKPVTASGDTAEYCAVRGYVATNVGFALRLPLSQWNGKFIELGCGGACGSTDHVEGCSGPVRQGYACIVSDGGHRSTGGDVKWAYNNPQAVMEYLVSSSHVTALAGKAIIDHYYGQTPRKSYFTGCSAGGEQAMWQAERFPWDFDGIIAGAPSSSLTEIWMNLVWANRALMDANAEPLLKQPDLELLHRAVVKRCDLNDGAKDGLIGDPRRCKFDPAEIRCPEGKTNQCLTEQQVEVVRKIYGGPVTSDGKQIVRSTALKGSEQNWLGFAGSAVNPNPGYVYMGEWFRYFFLQPNPGPAWTPEAFDFDRDYKRLGAAETVESINGRDLRRFKAKGGKLLSYVGWGDPGDGGRTADYYETSERIVGGRAATQEFFRLFVVPGMNHCGGGEGAWSVDYFSALEAWVEKDKAPDRLVGYHVKTGDLWDKAGQGDQEARHILERRLEFPMDPANVEFSRPIYPYPTMTRYLGHGDLKDAENFGPTRAED
jgi:hypothetical protein